MIAGGPLPPPPPPGDGGQYLPPAYPQPQYPTPAYYAGQLQAGPAPGIAYAGFWIRFAASLIDGIIVGVPLVILFLVIEGPAARSAIGSLTADADSAGAEAIGAALQ